MVAFTLEDGVDAAALGRFMRLWTGTIEAVTQGRAAPGDTARDLAQANLDLTVTVGWGPELFAKVGLPDARPAALADVPSFRHDRLEPRWSGGDLVVLVGAADDTTVTHVLRRMVLDARPFARVRWDQAGSWRGLDGDQRPTTGRNLFGQVDGTGNLTPADPLFDATLWAKTPDWFAGGTTLVVRRIRMDLEEWDRLTRDEQERAIGRDLTLGAPLTGTAESDQPDLDAVDDQGRPVIPADAHVRLAHPSRNGGARILRRGLNYTDYDPVARRHEAGLVFCAFQADLGAQFVPLQRRLDRGDALNTWTTAVGSASAAVLPGFQRGGWLGDTLLA
ncbi:MAG: Dyp-type peroxidase [Nocardioides sp.]